MIIFKIIKLLLPIFILNWIVSEADLIVPGSRASVLNLFEAVQIPTHDEWPESVKNLKVEEIGAELKDVIARYQNGDTLSNIGKKAQLSYNQLDEKVLNSNTSDLFDRKDMFNSLKGHKPIATFRK